MCVPAHHPTAVNGRAVVSTFGPTSSRLPSRSSRAGLGVIEQWVEALEPGLGDMCDVAGGDDGRRAVRHPQAVDAGANFGLNRNLAGVYLRASAPESVGGIP